MLNGSASHSCAPSAWVEVSKTLLSGRLKPLIPFPALVIENSETVLVVADLHIGWERAWSEYGIHVPSQAEKLQEKLVSLVDQYTPDRLILLGDIKQAITRVSMDEWREIPRFFEALQEHVDEVTVVCGNHDGDLEPLTPSTIKILPASGLTVGSDPRIGLFHGHAWPSAEVLAADILVMGHIHPVVWFRDRLGLWTVQQVWVKTACRGDLMASAYLKYLNEKTGGDPRAAFRGKTGLPLGDPRLIILPAFNDLVGGVSINRLETRLLGPLLRSGGVNVEAAEIYLLDGTYLGMTGQLQQYLTDLATR
jgi:putative SbcD/Mre11-related phosphoesterase